MKLAIFSIRVTIGTYPRQALMDIWNSKKTLNELHIGTFSGEFYGLILGWG